MTFITDLQHKPFDYQLSYEQRKSLNKIWEKVKFMTDAAAETEDLVQTIPDDTSTVFHKIQKTVNDLELSLQTLNDCPYNSRNLSIAKTELENTIMRLNRCLYQDLAHLHAAIKQSQQNAT